MNYSIVTCCNRIPEQPYYTLNEFIKSLNDEYIIVLDEKFGGTWKGLGSKAKWLYKLLTLGVIKTEFIIFCDCWDLVFTDPPKHLFETYLREFPEHPVVISSEKNCFPDDTKTEYDMLPYTSTYKYLNSGMIVGKVTDVIKILESMDVMNLQDDYRKEDGNNWHQNDQHRYQEEFLKQPVKMVLDYKQVLCQTMHDVSITELDLTGYKIRNVETGSKPCAIHFNGGAKTDWGRDAILNFLKL